MRRVFHPDAPRLADLIDDVARFRADDVYRRPLVSSGTARQRDVARFADPATLWSDLLGRSARRPTFRLVREGTTTAGGDVTRRARIGDRDLDDLAAPNRVIAGYRDGATVVLQGLHLTDPHLARFANNLALDLDQPVQVNAYLTPDSARGLDIHFDYHDVFVVQLEGSKRWRIWAPLERARHPVAGRHRVAKPTLAELPEEPLLDITLRTGDVLYLPRGYPHAAETTDEASAHLTIGMLAITWHRIVRRAVDAEVAAGRLSESVALSTLSPDAGGGEQALPDLEQLSLDPASDEVRLWTAAEIWSRQASTRLRRRSPITVAAGAVLAFTPGPLIWLTRRGDRCVLGLGDRSLTLPGESERFLAALLDTGERFVAADLPGLDDESRQVVIERLVDEGVLEVVG